MNIADVHPDDISTAPPQEEINRSPAQASPSIPETIHDVNPGEIQTEDEFLQSQYGTGAQQFLAGLEGAAQGVAGPLAPAAEIATGLTTPESIRNRAKANPTIHAVTELGGFAGSALIPGLGEASLAGQTANLGEHVAGLLPEATSTIAKIAQTGVKTGAEMAALQASDEISKMIVQDPDQSLQTAALNVGLAGVIGGAGGAVIGSVSPLWNKALNKIGIEKLASDFMGETKFLSENPDLVQGAAKELAEKMAEADSMWDTMGQTKPQVLEKAMPSVNPENSAKIEYQIQKVSDHMSESIEKAASSVKTKNAVPFISEDFENFQKTALNPNATFAEKFTALNDLKRTLEGYAKWGLTEEGSAKAALGRELSNYIRPLLEDTKVWGAAGDVQKVTNEAITNVIRATKDIRGKVLSNVMGDSVVAPEKVQTLINQTNAGKISNKANAIENYLESLQKYADAIKKVHLENGLESPIAAQLNPTPVLNHQLNTELTHGVKLARWAKQGGAAAMAANMTGHAAAETVGGGLGFLVGHPLAGAWMGDKILKPVFSALAKPLAEKAIDSSAAKASADYIGHAIKGQRILSDATKNFFKSGARIIGTDLVPNQASREKLEKSLEYADNPNNLMQAGSGLGHYLPDHATAATAMASRATEYLAQLKPKETQGNPLDDKIPIDPSEQAKYERALNVAQQPLIALQYAKEGTILPQDVEALQTIYPALHKQIVSQLGQEMIEAKTNGTIIPYKQRQGLSMIMGYPVDSSMTLPSLQSVLAANAPKGQPQASPVKHKSVSKPSAKMMERNNQLYATPSQSRSASKVVS